jgi:exopolysaccharide production protein ExoQ
MLDTEWAPVHEESSHLKLTFNPGGFARAAFFALLPLVAAGGAMGLPLLMGLAASAAIGPTAFRRLTERRPLALGLVTAFVVWAAASSLWSGWDGQTWLKILAMTGFGLLFAAGATADARAARLVLAGALASLLALAALLGIEAAWDVPLNTAVNPDLPRDQVLQNPARGLVVFLALVWPCLAALIAGSGALRSGAAALVALAGGALSLQFGQLSTAVGFGVGLVAFAVAFLTPAFTIRALTLGLAAWMLAAPFLTPLIFANQAIAQALPHSSAVRVGIWQYTSARILEQPWIGHGLDAGRATSEIATYDGEQMRAIPVHPHSASLQIWYETGAIGAAIAAAALAIGGWRLARAFKHDKPAAAAAAAVLAMFGFMANIGWSIWQEWWMATLLLAATLVAAVGARAARA